MSDMKKLLVSSILVAALLGASGCANAGANESQGAKVGALAGAVIGAVIGNQSGEAGAGAAIGAVAGAVAGSAIGADKDIKEAKDRRYERTTVAAQPVRDQYGYTFDDYMRLMTNEEMEILQSRADARPEVQMGVLLTDQEKANLRRRAQATKEIGR